MQVTEVAREDPLQLSRNTVQEQTAVIAFTALYYSGLPFQVRHYPQACSSMSNREINRIISFNALFLRCCTASMRLPTAESDNGYCAAGTCDSFTQGIPSRRPICGLQ